MNSKDIEIGDKLVYVRRGGRWMPENALGLIFTASTRVDVYSGSFKAYNPEYQDGWRFYFTPDMVEPITSDLALDAIRKYQSR